MKFVTLWVEIGEDNMKDHDELTAGNRKCEAATSAFE